MHIEVSKLGYQPDCVIYMEQEEMKPSVINGVEMNIGVREASCAGNNSDSRNYENTISKVDIFESTEIMGEKSKDIPILLIEDKEKIKLFSNLIDKAIKMDGILDMETPKYIAEISYLNKKEIIYFTIVKVDKSYSGMFVKKENTEVGYIFRIQDIEEFMKII